MDDPLENDLGLWIGRSSQMTPEEKITLLKSCWIPPMSYDFSKDVKPSERKFKHAWIQTYSPWLVYSKALKGGLCKFCVLFPPPIGSVKGILGSFMIKPFTRYKNYMKIVKNILLIIGTKLQLLRPEILLLMLQLMCNYYTATKKL